MLLDMLGADAALLCLINKGCDREQERASYRPRATQQLIGRLGS